jgi:hypothetical protein
VKGRSRRKLAGLAATGLSFSPGGGGGPHLLNSSRRTRAGDKWGRVMSLAPQTIFESRLKAIGLVLAGGAMAGVGAYTALQNWQQWPAALFCAALGLGAVALGVKLWSARRVLQLDPEGFVVSGGLFQQVRRYAWRDIDRFSVWSGAYASSLVAFSFLPGRAPQAASARPGHAGNVMGFLPAGWSLSTRDLVESLNAYLAAVRAEA